MSSAGNVSKSSRTCLALSMKECDPTSNFTNGTTTSLDLSPPEEQLLGLVCMGILVVCFAAYVPVLWVRPTILCDEFLDLHKSVSFQQKPIVPDNYPDGPDGHVLSAFLHGHVRHDDL